MQANIQKQSVTATNFVATITTPADADGNHKRYPSSVVVIRYYEGFGDGSVDGWQQAIAPPKVLLNNSPQNVSLWFSANSVHTEYINHFTEEDYLNGQTQGGFDQHAQYYDAGIDTSTGDEIVITGPFPLAGYLSVVAYFDDGTKINSQIEIIDYEMTAIPQGTNPYVEGNPSVFRSSVQPEPHSHEITQSVKRASADKDIAADTGEIYFYRTDVERSVSGFTDELAANGCSIGYLSAVNAYSKEVSILRLKVPTTFVHSSSPDTIFGHYQVRQISVNANKNTLPESPLDFWTVSSRMLNDYIDSEGYAYVFFAPDIYVKEIVALQGIQGQRCPPVYTWGNYKGYILGSADYAAIIRYRAPANDWQGNPGNAACPLSQETAQPVTFADYGEWLPEMYGDTLLNFENGHLGLVYNNQPWPE